MSNKYSYTDVRYDEAELEWKISTSNLQSSTVLSSPNFSTSLNGITKKWGLKVDLGNNDFIIITLFLHKVNSTATTNLVPAIYKFSILNSQNKKEIIWHTIMPMTFLESFKFNANKSHNTKYFGRVIFKSSEILKNIDKTDKILTIFCEITELGIHQPITTSWKNRLLTTISKPTWVKDQVNLFNKNRRNFDATLVVEGNTFRVHKQVLREQSLIFTSMFISDKEQKNQVYLIDMNLKVFNCILKFIYTNQIKNLDSRLAVDLLIAADQYQIEGIKTICAQVLQSNINVENFVEMLKLADCYNVKLLFIYTMWWIYENRCDKILSIMIKAMQADNLKKFNKWQWTPALSLANEKRTVTKVYRKTNMNIRLMVKKLLDERTELETAICKFKSSSTNSRL